MEVRKPIFLLYMDMPYVRENSTPKKLMSFGTSNFMYLKCLVIGRIGRTWFVEATGGLVDSKKSPTYGPTVRGSPRKNLST